MAIEFDDNDTPTRPERPFPRQEGTGDIVEVVIPDENEKHIPGSVALIGDGLKDDDLSDARKKAQEYTRGLVETDIRSTEFQQRVDRIGKFAEREMASMGTGSSRLLDSTLKEMKSGGGVSKKVSGSLLELRQEIDGIQGNNAKGVTKLLRKLPFGGNKAEEMLLRYETAQDTLNAIVDSLSRGQSDLEADSAALLSEMADIRQNAYKLAEWIEFMDAAKEEIDAEIATLRASKSTADQERADILSSKVLFKVNQRRQDLRTQFAVALSSHKTFELMINNNDQLVDAVERANAVIVPVLRTGLITGSALQTQEEIGNIIDSMSEISDSMLREHADVMGEHTKSIQKRATTSMIKPETIEYTLNKIAQIEQDMSKFELEASAKIQKSIENTTRVLGRTESARALLAGRSEEGRDMVAGALGRGSSSAPAQDSSGDDLFRS